VDSGFLRLARRVKEAEEAVGRYFSGGTISVGNGAKLADRNVGNTMFLEGLQNPDSGYINFSRYSGNALGAVNGGNLTWRGSRVWDAAGLPYETGTWTPYLYGATTAGSPTYHSRTGGLYVRIGSLCFIALTIYITARGGMAGTLRIGGLPFAAAGGPGNGVVGGAVHGHSSGKVTGQLDGGLNYMSLQKETGVFTASDLPSDTFAIWGMSGVYKIN